MHSRGKQMLSFPLGKVEKKERNTVPSFSNIFGNVGLQNKDGHIIFKELNNLDVDAAVIPKGIDKYMSTIVNRHITFIDSLQFYNSSLDTLASNLEDEDFQYLVSEFGIDKLEILRRKDAYAYSWID